MSNFIIGLDCVLLSRAFEALKSKAFVVSFSYFHKMFPASVKISLSVWNLPCFQITLKIYKVLGFTWTGKFG